MGKRRTARERALQALYELEFREGEAEAVLAAAPAEEGEADPAAAYTAWLVRGVEARKAELDALIQAGSRNWRVSRMTPVDRNVLRLAALELLEESRTLAPAIVINEAIEIAKRFGGEESADFVNGVLDAVRKRLAERESKEKADAHEPPRQPQHPAAERPAARRGAGAAKRPGAGPRRKA